MNIFTKVPGLAQQTRYVQSVVLRTGLTWSRGLGRKPVCQKRKVRPPYPDNSTGSLCSLTLYLSEKTQTSPKIRSLWMICDWIRDGWGKWNISCEQSHIHTELPSNCTLERNKISAVLLCSSPVTTTQKLKKMVPSENNHEFSLIKMCWCICGQRCCYQVIMERKWPFICEVKNVTVSCMCVSNCPPLCVHSKLGSVLQRAFYGSGGRVSSSMLYLCLHILCLSYINLWYWRYPSTLIIFDTYCIGLCFMKLKEPTCFLMRVCVCVYQFECRPCSHWCFPLSPPGDPFRAA